jgi:hypothetical protein
MTILISSYSKAYDIWPITTYFLNKFWKDDKDDIDIILGANGEDRKKFIPNGWKYINCGEDISFSKSLRNYLEYIDEEYFILMLDDFMILEDVNNSKIKEAFQFIKQNNGVYLRLTPNPKGDFKIDENFSKIDVKARVPYITSLQMAIWKKDFLFDLLKYDYDPWEFEIKAGKTKESLENCDKYFVTNYDFIRYTHFVEKGKFYPFVRELIYKEGLSLNFQREFLSEKELKRIKDSFVKRHLRKIIPPKYINIYRRVLGKNEL